MKSQKHQKKDKDNEVNHPFSCQYCEYRSKKVYGLSRHMSSCIGKKEYDNTKYIDSIKERKELEKIIELQEKEIEYKIKELENKDQLVVTYQQHIIDLEKMGKIVNGKITGVSAKKWITLNYPNAPPLEAIKDFLALDERFDKDIKTYVEVMISEKNNNNLSNYIGDIMLKYYSKQDPSKQSLWSSDTARLTYVAKISNKNDSKWCTDKNGTIMSNITIKPLLDFTDSAIREYINYLPFGKKTHEIEENNAKIRTGLEIIDDISNRKLSDEINKYMSAKLFWRNSINMNMLTEK